MYLFVDTETNGLPANYKAPVTDLNNWPRLVQIAWIIFNRTGYEVDRRDYIIKPEGFKIPSDAEAIHGISTEKALKHGVSLKTVLSELDGFLNQATTIVAHNISFDEMIIGAEFLRIGRQNPFERKTKICTMKQTTDYVGIKGYYGNKWPKLGELHEKLFGYDFAEAHNAAADINATAKCFWEAKRLGIIEDSTHDRNSQRQNEIALRFDGIYQSEKSKGHWHYLRFYGDGTVMVTISPEDYVNVLKWFSKEMYNQQSSELGKYQIDENRIQFSTNPQEGPTFYNGIVERNCLTLNIQWLANDYEKSKPFFFIPMAIQFD